MAENHSVAQETLGLVGLRGNKGDWRRHKHISNYRPVYGDESLDGDWLLPLGVDAQTFYAETEASYLSMRKAFLWRRRSTRGLLIGGSVLSVVAIPFLFFWLFPALAGLVAGVSALAAASLLRTKRMKFDMSEKIQTGYPQKTRIVPASTGEYLQRRLKEAGAEVLPREIVELIGDSNPSQETLWKAMEIYKEIHGERHRIASFNSGLKREIDQLRNRRSAEAKRQLEALLGQRRNAEEDPEIMRLTNHLRELLSNS